MVNMVGAKKKFDMLPKVIVEKFTQQVEKESQTLVDMINKDKPFPEIEVGWTWGDVPRGAISIGKVANKEFQIVRTWIYARGIPYSDPEKGFAAAWFEFGTDDRYHKSGKFVGRIQAVPFFFPNYKRRKANIQRNLKNAINRGIKAIK